MSEFEFFTVAVSIILALGIGRLLDGIAPALESARRYWVHVGWIAQKLSNCVMWWWGLWGAARNFEWNLAFFVLSHLGPGVLFLQASALVTPMPSLVPSWRDRFFEIRPWLFAGNIALCSILLFLRAVSPDPLVALVPPGLVLLAFIAAVGIITENPRIHVVLVVSALAVQILGMGAALFEAGRLASPAPCLTRNYSGPVRALAGPTRGRFLASQFARFVWSRQAGPAAERQNR